MSSTVEITAHGFAIIDRDGVCLAHVSLTSGVAQAALIVSVGADAPIAALMTREQVRQLEDIVRRVALGALFARTADPVEGRITPRVPRAPHFPS